MLYYSVTVMIEYEISNTFLQRLKSTFKFTLITLLFLWLNQNNIPEKAKNKH